MSGERMYSRFHGHSPDGITEVEWEAEPESLVVLGRAVAIEYECDKSNGGGDGTLATYRHELHRDDLLLTDAQGRMLVVIGPRLRVTERGIVN